MDTCVCVISQPHSGQSRLWVTAGTDTVVSVSRKGATQEMPTRSGLREEISGGYSNKRGRKKKGQVRRAAAEAVDNLQMKAGYPAHESRLSREPGPTVEEHTQLPMTEPWSRPTRVLTMRLLRYLLSLYFQRPSQFTSTLEHGCDTQT